MKIVIIKYNAGNIRSVDFALKRLGIEAIITDDLEAIQKADKIIFPGVGEASSAMQYLIDKSLDVGIKNLQQPVLGICLGMQLLCAYSPEGNTTCLNIFENVHLNKFETSSQFKVPQIGWNKVEFNENKLFENSSKYIYNVHSYYVPVNKYTTATCNYGINYSAAMQKNNFYGVQFHPEKSGEIGELILKNFMDL